MKILNYLFCLCLLISINLPKAYSCNNPERFQVGIVNGEPYAFVDQAGNPFIMKGVNVRRAINTNRTVRYTQAQFDQIAAQGFNTLRLPLNWKDFETSAGNFSSTAFNSLDVVIQRAENAGLHIILDPIHIKGGDEDYWNIPTWAWGGVAPNGNRVFAELQVHVLPYLQEITARYCNNPTVIAIDLINEPREAQTVNGLDNRNQVLVSFYVSLINNLRQIDPNKPFMVEPFYGSARITANRLTPLNQFDNIIWSFHDYYAGRGTPSDGYTGGGYADIWPQTESWTSSGTYSLNDNHREEAISDMIEHIDVHRNAALGAGIGFHIGEYGIPEGWTNKSDFLCDKLSIYSDLNIPTTAWVWNKDIDGGFGIWHPQDGWMPWSDAFTNPDCFDEDTPPTNCNIIQNGSFSSGDSNWTDYAHSSTSVLWNTNNGYADFNISNGGNSRWRVQLNQTGFDLEQGASYELQFRARADANKTIYCKLSNQNDNATYYYSTRTVGITWQTYNLTFTMNAATNTNARLNFGIGQNNIDIAFDDISLQKTDCNSCVALEGIPCDDGDVCTTEDVYDNNCNCSGTYQDSDNDGVCDSNDVCPGMNDALIGTACSDGDGCTTGDTYNNNCNCVGTYTDADEDGYCVGDDPNDSDPCVPVACPGTCNLVQNSDFNGGNNQWEFYRNSAANANLTTPNNARISISNGGTRNWHIQLFQTGLSFENGERYLISFRARAAANRTIGLDISRSSAPHTTYYAEDVALSTTWEHKYFIFEPSVNNANARIVFNMGLNNADVWIDDVVVEKLSCSDANNLIVNSHFDNNTSNWTKYANAAAQANPQVINGELQYAISNGGTRIWHIQEYQTGISLSPGTHTLSFKAKADAARSFKVELTDTSAPYTEYFATSINLSTNLTTYNMTFNVSQSDTNARLVFNLGLNAADVTLDDILLISSTGQGAKLVNENTPDIQVFPNPFRDRLTLSLKNIEQQQGTISMYDLSGRLLHTQAFNNEETVELNTSKFIPGVYLLQVRVGGQVYVRKLVK